MEVDASPPSPPQHQCIVIGCKYGLSAFAVETATTTEATKPAPKKHEFVQVPSMSDNNVNSLLLARQWYINTLREDLFDQLISNKTPSMPTPHFVCLDHFDEDSILIANNGQKQLKPNALPSLFEIQVFQRMILHQEQLHLQQEAQKQQQQQKEEKGNNKFKLLSSLLSTAAVPPQTASSVRPSGGEKVGKALKRTAMISVLQQQRQQQQQQQQQLSVNNITGSGVRLGKAVKHTQPFRSMINDQSNQLLKGVPVSSSSSGLVLPNGHKLTGVKHATSLIASVQPAPSTISNNNYNNSYSKGPAAPHRPLSNGGGDKMTTYVYKRVHQELEIDLNMECEEEEFEYIRRPVQPPPPPQPIEEQTSELVSTDVTTFYDDDDIKSSKSTAKSEKTTRNKSSGVEATSTTKKEKSTETAKATATKASKSRQSVETEIVKKKKQTGVQHKTNVTGVEGFKLVFDRFYGRREGAVQASIKNVASKKSIPPDLRVGNYPPKCNICNLMLENNIDLTSHICTHLESTGDEIGGEQTTYISPFDAVTTICSLCDAKFENPFDLIKHLDLTHMKQLAEFKCRICEKQHAKLNELVNHLNNEHKVYEMPYRCDACGFRTSFYADAIYHIKKEHTNTLHHFCPYCLKSFALPYHKKQGFVECTLFYSHLQTHFNRATSKNTLVPSRCKHCPKCIMHVRFMSEHMRYDHSSNLPPSPPTPPTTNKSAVTTTTTATAKVTSQTAKVKSESDALGQAAVTDNSTSTSTTIKENLGGAASKRKRTISVELVSKVGV